MFIEPVIGFRSWNMGTGNYRLISKTNQKPWDPNKETLATCKPPISRVGWGRDNPVHEVPHLRCECGLYAYKTAKALREHYNESPRSICGAVACWGHIIDHDDGFRAEKAMPIVLCMRQFKAPGWSEFLHKLARFYGVKVIDSDELEEYALHYGSLLTDYATME